MTDQMQIAVCQRCGTTNAEGTPQRPNHRDADICYLRAREAVLQHRYNAMNRSMTQRVLPSLGYRSIATASGWMPISEWGSFIALSKRFIVNASLDLLYEAEDPSMRWRISRTQAGQNVEPVIIDDVSDTIDIPSVAIVEGPSSSLEMWSDQELSHFLGGFSGEEPDAPVMSHEALEERLLAAGVEPLGRQWAHRYFWLLQDKGLSDAEIVSLTRSFQDGMVRKPLARAVAEDDEWEIEL